MLLYRCHSQTQFLARKIFHFLFQNKKTHLIPLAIGHGLLGLYSLRRRRLTGIGIPMINLRRSDDRIRFIMGIHTVGLCALKEHYSGVTWASLRVKSPLTRLSVWQLVQAANKKSSKPRITSPLCVKSNGDRWFSPPRPSGNTESVSTPLQHYIWPRHTRWCRYNAVVFLKKKNHKWHPIARPSFVIVNSDVCSAWATDVLCAKSYDIGPRYDGIWLY